MSAEVLDLANVKVLLIDDEDDMRTMGQMCLSLLSGAEVTCASSGPEGVQLAEEIQPDVIVLDLMMPDVDGAETIRRLQANPKTQAIPVIFLTVKGIPSEIRRLTALGALAVLQKPYEPTELGAQIRQILSTNGGRSAVSIGSDG